MAMQRVATIARQRVVEWRRTLSRIILRPDSLLNRPAANSSYPSPAKLLTARLSCV